MSQRKVTASKLSLEAVSAPLEVLAPALQYEFLTFAGVYEVNCHKPDRRWRLCTPQRLQAFPGEIDVGFH